LPSRQLSWPAPDRCLLGDQLLYRRAGRTTTASGFSPGPNDKAGQTSLGYTVVSNTAPELFAVAPALDTDGTQTYTPRPGARGTATIGVVVRDSGSTANGGVETSTLRTFTITVGENCIVYLPLTLR
jgi:hypothetical protein